MDSSTATASSAAPAQKGVFNFTFAPNVTPDTFVTTVPTASAATPAAGSDEASAASPQSSTTPGSSSAQLFPPSSPRGRTHPKRPTHAKRRGSGHIPRPPNAFILFRAEFVKNRHIPDTIETQHSGLSKIVGACWRKLPFEERAIWEEKAKSASEEHKEKHPGYKYRPAPARTASKKNSSPSKRETAAAQKPLQITAPAQQQAQAERKAEDVAQLLLNGKRGSALNAAFNDLQRERSLRQPQQPSSASAFAPFAAAGPFGYLPAHLQHRRSSSAPPTQNAQQFMAPAHRNSIVYAHNDSHLDAAPLASLAVRSLALEPAMGSFGLSPNMMDSSSPPPLMPGPVTGDADAIAAELFGAFTQNPFAAADALGQAQQQPSSEANNFNFPMEQQLSQMSELFDPSFMAAGNFSPMDAQFPAPMDAGASFTYDVSTPSFPSDTIPSSSDLATWASIPVHPSPPAEMPELLDPSSVQYPDYGAWAPQSHASPAAAQAQYTQYNSQPAATYYSSPPSAAYAPRVATECMSFATYDSSGPVTPIIEPEEKAFYQYVKDNLSLVSPTPTSAYGMPNFLTNTAY